MTVKLTVQEKHGNEKTANVSVWYIKAALDATQLKKRNHMSKMAMRKKKSKNLKNLEVRWSWKLGRAVDGGLHWAPGSVN